MVRFLVCFVRTVSKSALPHLATTHSSSCTVGAHGGACNRFVSIRRGERARAYHKVVVEPSMEAFDVLLRTAPRTREAHAPTVLLPAVATSPREAMWGWVKVPSGIAGQISSDLDRCYACLI